MCIIILTQVNIYKKLNMAALNEASGCTSNTLFFRPLSLAHNRIDGYDEQIVYFYPLLNIFESTNIDFMISSPFLWIFLMNRRHAQLYKVQSRAKSAEWGRFPSDEWKQTRFIFGKMDSVNRSSRCHSMSSDDRFSSDASLLLLMTSGRKVNKKSLKFGVLLLI